MAASTKGLEKVSGYSFEDVIEALKRGRIPHKVMDEPYTTQQFFRQSVVKLNEDNVERRLTYINKIRDMAGATRASGDGLICYASYRITPEFDFSLLDGHPRFKKGLLVEATWVY